MVSLNTSSSLFHPDLELNIIRNNIQIKVVVHVKNSQLSVLKYDIRILVLHMDRNARHEISVFYHNLIIWWLEIISMYN